jgi:hypothetical protein
VIPLDPNQRGNALDGKEFQERGLLRPLKERAQFDLLCSTTSRPRSPAAACVTAPSGSQPCTDVQTAGKVSPPGADPRVVWQETRRPNRRALMPITINHRTKGGFVIVVDLPIVRPIGPVPLRRSADIAPVTSFGGFLGMGEDYYPLPWSQLNGDAAMGFRVLQI